MFEFSKALRVESVEIKEELLWEYPREFLEELWKKIKYELRKVGEVNWDLHKFLNKVEEEVKSRGWDLRKFRNEKAEPVLNLFKRIIREIAKESNLPLSNDTLSKILNYIRNQYSSSGLLIGAIYPVRAFFERDSFDLPDDLGDDRSCFRAGGCNQGSALWLKIEEEKYNRAKFVVFHYKSHDKEGWGRCWVYTVSPYAIFATNFYSKRFEIKAHFLKYSLVRLLRLLFNLSENCRFAFNKNISLPIYLNGDGLIIYEREHYSNSDEVIQQLSEIVSECMVCHQEVRLIELSIFDKELEYEQKKVPGLIICRSCREELETEICEGCGERFYRDDMIYYDNAYWCDECFQERYGKCCICKDYYWRDDMVVDRYENWLCRFCVNEHRKYCKRCGMYVYPDEGYYYEVLNSYGIEEEFICDECEKELKKAKCECCGKEYHYFLKDYVKDRVREVVNAGLCFECYKKKEIELKDEIFKNEQFEVR